jgi:hypothetical protein
MIEIEVQQHSQTGIRLYTYTRAERINYKL